MLPLIAFLLACGGPTELAQPNPPPDPWPMSRAVIAHATQAAGDVEDAAAPAEEGVTDEEVGDEEPVQEAATPGEAPAPAEGTRPEQP